jgi:hypothetical protein
MLEGLHNSLDYFERLQKKIFAVIRQFGPPIFLSLLHLPKEYEILSLKFYIHYMLQIPNKRKDLHSVHIVKLIQINLITCARYNDHIPQT